MGSWNDSFGDVTEGVAHDKLVIIRTLNVTLVIGKKDLSEIKLPEHNLAKPKKAIDRQYTVVSKLTLFWVEMRHCFDRLVRRC